MAAATLMTVHNLFVYLDIMGGIRQSIRLCRFGEYRRELLRSLAARDGDEETRGAP
jgi:queuine/archaeosine tRNA-ribosyltransferase